MRCLSPHSRYSIQVIEGQEQVVTDARGYAQTVVLHKPVIADFDRMGLLDYEIEAALEKFNFSGLPEGVNPLTRIAAFDSEAYCERFPEKAAAGTPTRDEMLVQIDARLRDLQVQNPNEFIIVEPPEAPRPWPSYDEDSVEDILKFQERLQIPAQTIRLYELENQNRDEIVKAMLAIEDPAFAEAQQAEGEEEPVTVNA